MKYTTTAQQMFMRNRAADEMMMNMYQNIIAKAKADGYDVSFIGDEIVLTKNNGETSK